MRSEPQISGGVRFDAARGDLDARIGTICGRQRQVIRLEQLVELELSPSGVDKRARRHRLYRIHHAVFASHGPPHSPHQRWLAAAFACGPGSTISDLPAAWLLGMTEDLPSLPHVSNRTGSGRTRPGIVVHERAVERRDVIGRYGIPCTTPARTILDCAASVTIEQLEELLMAADSGRPGLDRRRLEQLVAEHGGQRGISNLRELISDDPRETRSRNERRMLRICRRFGVPKPLTNHEVKAGGRTFYADFCWPDLALIVEADSWRWHGGRLKVERDRDRDQLLAIAGWVVVHFTRNQIKLEPERTGKRLRALTSQISRR